MLGGFRFRNFRTAPVFIRIQAATPTSAQSCPKKCPGQRPGQNFSAKNRCGTDVRDRSWVMSGTVPGQISGHLRKRSTIHPYDQTGCCVESQASVWTPPKSMILPPSCAQTQCIKQTENHIQFRNFGKFQGALQHTDATLC